MEIDIFINETFEQMQHFTTDEQDKILATLTTMLKNVKKSKELFNSLFL